MGHYFSNQSLNAKIIYGGKICFQNNFFDLKKIPNGFNYSNVHFWSFSVLIIYLYLYITYIYFIFLPILVIPFFHLLFAFVVAFVIFLFLCYRKQDIVKRRFRFYGIVRICSLCVLLLFVSHRLVTSTSVEYYPFQYGPFDR